MELSEVAGAYDLDDPRLAQPVIGSMDNMTRYCAMLAASRLLACARAGYSDVLKARKIIDFGTGSGASAFSLGLLAQQSRGSVDALELNTNLDWAEKIEQTGLTRHLPVRVHDGDGLQWISSRAQEGERYDLIAGCWFGPDYTGDLARGLLTASQQALASGGLLIVYSDLPTMKSVQNVCNEEPGYHLIEGQKDVRLYEPDMVVIRQP